MVPSVTGVRPLINFRIVDFPHPEGPTTVTTSPGLTDKSKSFNIVNLSCVLRRSKTFVIPCR